MTLEDFEVDNKGYRCDWISKEKFWFENKKVAFWYRLGLIKFEYQPGCSDYWTRYQVLLMVDEESLHESRKPLNIYFPIEDGYFIKEKEKRGRYNENDMEKLVNSALKLKIENVIKENRYEKILGLLNGTTFHN